MMGQIALEGHAVGGRFSPLVAWAVGESHVDAPPASPMAARIAACNDAFRRSLDPDLGVVRLDESLAMLTPKAQQAVVAAVRDADAGDDCFGEHDRGRLRVGGRVLCWRIDCLDLAMEQRSSNPSDPRVTIRVLTIGQAKGRR